MGLYRSMDKVRNLELKKTNDRPTIGLLTTPSRADDVLNDTDTNT